MTDNAHRLLKRAANRWRARGLLPYFVLLLLAAVVSTAAITLSGLPQWLLPATCAVILLALFADRHWRISGDVLYQKLDAHFPALQDSSQLLRSSDGALTPLLQLQRARTADALQQLYLRGELKKFYPRGLRSPLLNAVGACLGLWLAAIYFGSGAATQQTALVPATTTPGPVVRATAIAQATTKIEPPEYTGLATTNGSLEIEAPEQSRITWVIALNAPAHGLQMLAATETFAFEPVEPVPSHRWQLTRTVTETDFYQLAIIAEKTAQESVLPQLHNIDITPDLAPEFAFDYPRDNVTVISGESEGQSALLQVSVTVQDDFAVTGTDLLLTLASGSGENVRFRNERIKLQPKTSDGKQTYYRFAIPAARYEIEPGDELYWYLEARDNRRPRANVQKSQHFILRWPQQEIFGLSDAEGMAIKVLPEYFRSQRQLIIDTEALLADEGTISGQEFRKRAESLAYEQNLLRMRYGRFLGEEDSDLEHGGDDHGGPSAGEESEHADSTEREHGGEHDEHNDQQGAKRQFGDASGVVASAGHRHDSSEHATLFDPETKELLRSALNAMWSAWRDLSIIEPRASLPYQHTALRYIKQVQQASRIYLQRVGFETPPLDEGRRLSGEHGNKVPPRVVGERADAERAQLRGLLDKVRNGEAIDEVAEASLRDLPSLRNDTAKQLALAKYLRRYRQQPACENCRRQLSGFLYTLLPAPRARPTMPRERAPAGGYREWLQQAAEDAQ